MHLPRGMCKPAAAPQVIAEDGFGASVAETALDVEAEVEVGTLERRALVSGCDVLIDVCCVAITDQELEVMPADHAFHPDRPSEIGVHVFGQIAVFRSDLTDH